MKKANFLIFFFLATLTYAQDRNAFGTAFFVSENGHLVTCYHVIEGAERIHVTVDQKNYEAEIFASDTANDLALLKINKSSIPLQLSGNAQLNLGEKAISIGYPNPSIQGTSPKYTSGEISSKFGIFDDPRTFQISVPIQPGNSGGPIICSSGLVIGVTSSSLDAIGMMKVQGSIPQNVNYAIKIDYVKALLNSQNISFPQGNDSVSEIEIKDMLDSICLVVTELKESFPSGNQIERGGVVIRSAVLRDGIPEITIRNNNPFFIQNLRGFISFSSVLSNSNTKKPVYSWNVDDLIPPGTDYNIRAFSQEHWKTLQKHSQGKTEEWIPIFKEVGFDKVIIE